MTQDEAFIAEIMAHPEDLTIRLIYADWLEEQNDPRGVFVRLEAELSSNSPPGKIYREMLERLRQLREQLPRDWLAKIDKTAIENCPPRNGPRSLLSVVFEFRCPRRWEALQTTEDGSVRFCTVCKKNVYHCESVAEAQSRARQAQCVAVDSRLERKAGDLHEKQMLLGVIGPRTFTDVQENVPSDGELFTISRPLVETQPPQGRERSRKGLLGGAYLQRGQSVYIVSGDYAGLSGEIEQVHKKGQRFVVRILVGGRYRRVNLPRNEIDPE